jgi:hypothetical protein
MNYESPKKIRYLILSTNDGLSRAPALTINTMTDACQQLLDASFLQSLAKSKGNQLRKADLPRVPQGPEITPPPLHLRVWR